VFIDTVMTRTFAAHVGKRLRIDRKKDGTTAAFTEV
jgi:hypothetical protein